MKSIKSRIKRRKSVKAKKKEKASKKVFQIS